MWSEKRILFFFAILSLCSSGYGLFEFPYGDWMNQPHRTGEQNKSPLRHAYNPAAPEGGKLQEPLPGHTDVKHNKLNVRESHFGPQQAHPKGQELEEIKFVPLPAYRDEKQIQETHFGPKPNEPKGQEIEEIHFGPKPNEGKGQEIEEIHFGPKPSEPKGQEIEEIHFGPKPNEPKGQEVEEIHFGPKPSEPKGQEVEEIHFGPKPSEPKGQEVEEIHFGPKPNEPKGQKIEEIHFGPKPSEPKGQEIEEIHFGPKPNEPKGQEVEEIHFGPKPNEGKGQEIEEIHFGHKPNEPKGQEVEEIHFGPKPNEPKGQEVEEIHFGPKPNEGKGQKIEEIHFGPKPNEPKEQGIEDLHFGPNPNGPKGQEHEEIRFVPLPIHPNRRESEVNHVGLKSNHSKALTAHGIKTRFKRDSPSEQEPQNIRYKSVTDDPEDREPVKGKEGKPKEMRSDIDTEKPMYEGSEETILEPEPREIRVGPNPFESEELEPEKVLPKSIPHELKQQESETLEFDDEPDEPKEQVPQTINLKQESQKIDSDDKLDYLNEQEHEDILFESKPENSVGQVLEGIQHGPKPNHSKKQKKGGAQFGSETLCEGRPRAPPNAIVKCKSSRKCRIFCQRGFRFPTGVDKIDYVCEHGIWTSTLNVTAECSPFCNPPCENNGTCIGNNECECPENFKGSRCHLKGKACIDIPLTPVGSFVNCNSSACVVTCHENHVFPDGSSTTDLVCDNGQWTLTRDDWDSVPDCEPLCEPPCINGGTCLNNNQCQCPTQYAGPQCQFDKATCDMRKLNFDGFSSCKEKDDTVACEISCPEGLDTDIPIAPLYTCDYSVGEFVPTPIPKCLYDKDSDNEKWPNSSYTIVGDPSISVNLPPGLMGECTSWGSHFKNFDGDIFSFDGDCTYTLAKDIAENTFQITSEATKCESPPCPRNVKIHYQHNDYEIHYEGKTPILMVNDEKVQVPTQLGGFLCEKKGDKIVISLQTIDVSLNWNAKDHLTIAVNENMWDKTGGLCGNFNNNPKDDFITPDGTFTRELEVFVQSWAEETYDCPEPKTQYDCNHNDASNYCKKIFNHTEFKICSSEGKLSNFEKACVWDVCRCGKKCACDTIFEFTKYCRNFLKTQGLPDSTSKWRRISRCPMKCEAGKVYSGCGPSVEPACGSIGMDDKLAKYSDCVEGCFCPNGLVYFNNSCIPKELCPCYWRNAQYSEGDMITKDCNTCTCQSGKWTCTTLQCSSTCSISGSSHYFTFDGRRYDWMGQCSYYLLKTSDYSIASEDIPCQSESKHEISHKVNSRISFCSKLITIRRGASEIKLNGRKQVHINDVEVLSLPKETDEVLIRTTSHFVIVRLPDRTEVWWDGNANLYIDIPGNPHPRRLLGGLCGIYNNNQKDDFKTPEGDIESTATTFVEKWKTDENCIEVNNQEKLHPCDVYDKFREIAEKECQKLKGDVFKDCHSTVDVEPYYKNCLYDACSCQSETSACTCSIFADYARECARQFKKLPWRKKIHECGLECRNGEIYQSCGSSCAKSCEDISLMNGHCDEKCVEGCSCPNGLVLNTYGKCVPVSKCPCFYQHKIFNPNDKVIMENSYGTQSCVCVNALWSCKPLNIYRETLEHENNIHQCNETAHEEYTTCAPAEPKSCKNMHEKRVNSTRICFPGCVCKKGFVWDSVGKLCVKPSQCPCHHGGKSYANGDKVKQECNTCTCVGGIWSCSQKNCSAICSTWGDSHFKTFDGKIYDFQGACEYVLATGSISEHESFFISLKIVPCGTTGISCPKSVTIKVESPGQEEEVVFKKSKQLLIPKDLKRIMVREVGLFVVAEIFDLGISVQWDKGTRVYVKANPKWKNKIKGLCGSFNDDDGDDFKTPSSGETSEISQTVFVDSWRLDTQCSESKPTPDTCDHRSHRKEWAVDKCSILNSEIFEPCHSEVVLEPYLERCTVDACGCDEGGDCECLCTAIAAYAEECTLRGVYIKWRSQHLCPIQCDPDTEYNECISKCPPKSCDNQYHYSAILQVCSEDACVEGCEKPRCPIGQVLVDSSSDHCVSITSCKTVCLKINNVTYWEGDLMESDDCHSCYCSHHEKVCTGQPCSQIVITETPAPTTACPEGEVWDDCIVKCDRVCNYLLLNSNEFLHMHLTQGCVSGCRAIDLNCANLFLRDSHACVLERDCPCMSRTGVFVKPGDVLQESECEKCQCINNEYHCIYFCPTTPVVQPPAPTPVTAEIIITPPPDGFEFISCPSGSFGSLLDSLSKFSASSHLDNSSAPEFGKITSNGIWTAGRNDSDQYLQVDLQRVEPIYGVSVAGDFDKYVTGYHILHSLNGVKFIDMFNLDGKKEIFGGPFGGQHSVNQVLRTPIEARYIRFQPVSWHNQISMKVDVLGCKHDVEIIITPVPSICRVPIGIGKNYFPTLRVTLSSSKPENGPDAIGLYSEGGWQPLTNSKSEWIQLDFGTFVEITGIITKGVRQNNLSSPLTEESWVERFKVDYSQDGFSWNPILDEFGDPMTFMGNTDAETAKTNIFKLPIRVKSVKIIPLQWHRNIALRLDMMGCYGGYTNETVVIVSSPVVPVECNLCPGFVTDIVDCTCSSELWWDGINCVNRSECPCYEGTTAYPVGATFMTGDCQECVCRFYGVSHCNLKECADCPPGLQKIRTPLCGCLCKACEENFRLCPTSNICLRESAWCDGIQDCPDDEINCFTTPIIVISTPSPCLATCPPGYDLVFANKTDDLIEIDDHLEDATVKSVKTKTSVKIYKKRKPLKLPECPQYDCIPVEKFEIECHPPECPESYLVVLQKINVTSDDFCPSYTCEPVPEYVTCHVMSKMIKTFDGLEYKYEICDHVLTTHDSNLWNISVIKNCSLRAPCANSVLIHHNEHILEFNPNDRFIKYDSFTYTVEQAKLLSSKVTDFSFDFLGDSVTFLSNTFAFEVICDTTGNIYIKVPDQMKGRLIGLCGLYNGVPNDDKTLPDHKLSKTVVEFGESWRNPGGRECFESDCPVEMQYTAVEICRTLLEEPFDTCQEKVNMDLCFVATCECLAANKSPHECKCLTLSNFASKCKKTNLFGWRTKHNCYVYCPPNLVHYDCYPYECEPTCGNEECRAAATDCYSGCFCPDGLVRWGEACIQPSDCRDCTCSGLGDSTYLTFHGPLLFNGDCKYLATRSIASSGIPNFEVFFTNSLCNGSDFMTCTDQVEIAIPDHSVQIKALPGTTEMFEVLIDGKKINVPEVDTSWAMVMLNSEHSTIQVALPQHHVDVRYLYNKFGFSISLPSHIYSGKLEGLCGTCLRSFEEIKEVIDPKEWEVEGKICNIPPPTPCTYTEESQKICSLMSNSTVFGQCFAFVDPASFIEQCLLLGCLKVEFCGIFEAYAQACREAGVCVNWRSSDFCLFSCPPDLEYQFCHTGCHRTCENYDVLSTTCKNPSVEGCFCPPGEMWINGTCKHEKYCKACDSDGHHFDGETWRVDKCTSCSCNNRVVTCERTECPVVDMKCGAEEILVKDENDYECCPTLKCVCQPIELCPVVVMPTDLLPGMKAVIISTGCCPRLELTCDIELCPVKVPCEEPYIEKTFNTTACCPVYICEKPPDVCIYEFSVESNNKVIKNIGETWKDGRCKMCDCMKTNNSVEVICSVPDCLSLKQHSDFEDYVLEEVDNPDKCCPEVVRKACKYDCYTYEVGQTWELMEKNPCETMKCIIRDGIIVKETRMEICNTTCEIGWEYQHLEGSCCGRCVQVGCLVDGQIIRPGEVWQSQDGCSKGDCVEHNGFFSFSTETEKCPSIEDCPQENIYQDTCCLRCNVPHEDLKNCNAKLIAVESTVRMVTFKKDGHILCQNEEPLENFIQCVGNCYSYTVFRTETFTHESICKCCTAQEYSLITVPLTCENGDKLTKSITVPSKCYCTNCRD